MIVYLQTVLYAAVVTTKTVRIFRRFSKLTSLYVVTASTWSSQEASRLVRQHMKTDAIMDESF